MGTSLSNVSKPFIADYHNVVLDSFNDLFFTFKGDILNLF